MTCVILLPCTNVHILNNYPADFVLFKLQKLSKLGSHAYNYKDTFFPVQNVQVDMHLCVRMHII